MTLFARKVKISKYQMPNDQMPNYGVQTQYVSIFQLGLQARNVTNQRKIITTDRTALLIPKPVKCLQQRETKRIQ